MKNQKTLRIVRWIILLSILVLTTVLGRLHQLIKFYPPIDAFCPFGGLESLGALLRYQLLLKKVALSSVILLITTISTALIFRRSFCGEICPLGFLQEIFGLTGRRIFKKRFNLPLKLDSILRYLKYPILVLFVGLAWRTMELSISPFDPWVAYHHLGTEDLFSKNLVGFTVLSLSLLLGLIIERPFCRYLCPMGGFLGLVSKIGFTKIRREGSTCIDCGKCDMVCPVNIVVSKEDVITTAECLTCSECINVCPVPNTLNYVTSGKNRKKIPVKVLLWGTLFIFVSVITVTTITKKFVWKTETGLDIKVERLFWGPSKIDGDNALIDIVQVYRIHPSYFETEFNLTDENQFYMTLNELEIEPDSIREIIEKLYSEAGLDPKKILSGGGCGGH